jgi:hypothetical protein
MTHKIVVDVQTGEVTRVEYTPEEQAEYDATVAAQQAEEQAEYDATVAAQQAEEQAEYDAAVAAQQAAELAAQQVTPVEITQEPQP